MTSHPENTKILKLPSSNRNSCSANQVAVFVKTSIDNLEFRNLIRNYSDQSESVIQKYFLLGTENGNIPKKIEVAYDWSEF